MALIALEVEGFTLRGEFTSANSEEWCDRRLLARIHRYTIDRLRSEIEPVTAADFLRFLFGWHHVSPDHRLDGPAALVAVLDLLEGFEMPLSAWEGNALPSRLRHYDPAWLDQLCLSGELAWARLYPPNAAPAENGSGGNGKRGRKSGATRSSPVSMVFRENLPTYLSLDSSKEPPALKGAAKDILELLQQRGASFMQDMARATGRLPAQVEEGLSELVARGLVTSDGFEGLRSLTSPARSKSLHRMRPGQRSVTKTMMAQRMGSGRWSLLDRNEDETEESVRTEFIARKLLRRYGVVFHRLLLREPHLPPWRDLLRVFRKLEARGEIRGGRFVAGFSGEQYALPHAISQLRAARRAKPDGTTVTVGGADPLNLVGILTPGQRVPSLPTNRVTYRDGVPEAVEIRGYLFRLETLVGDVATTQMTEALLL
jgi:ATP-dependent Lhr-like helicase